MFHRMWTGVAAPWAAVLLAIVCLGAVTQWVDLSPKVESDFFFAADDPQFQTSLEIKDRFGGGAQIIVRVADLSGDPDAHRERLGALTDDLLSVEGVTAGFSITTDDAGRSPLFSRILLTPDSLATNVVVQVDDTDPAVLLPRLDEVVARHTSAEMGIVMSGVPVIVELIRRALFRDLVVFSLAAVLVFAFLIAGAYRDLAIVTGTTITCLVSVSATLLLTRAAGVSIGLLTANLVTIVFVLTLSHVVFLSANWLRASVDQPDRVEALRRGIADTLEGSFWSMATTLLGFLSLLAASAKPLRELGIAGAIGALTAMITAYIVFPAFLGRWARPRRAEAATPLRAAWRAPRRAIVGVGVGVVLVGAGIVRLDTDPGLLTYFSPKSDMRVGLEQIDEDGGSSILDIVVRDTDGGRIDSNAVFEKMQALQASLEADPAVGMVLSPSVLLEHARTMPLARFLSLEILLDLASSPQLGGVGRAYVTDEREEGHYLLRMREGVGESSRERVMARLVEDVRSSGMEPVLVGGLYDLQAQLGRLIASSLKVGIGGLLVLFLLVGFAVSRSAVITGWMWMCLAGIPLVVLGTFGHFGIAVDIITSPAANIALAMGVDSMIHLVVRRRRLNEAGVTDAWSTALAQIRGPVLTASGIICAGFGIFVASSFPPTRRFGLAVMLGTVTAATMALLVLPGIAEGRRTSLPDRGPNGPSPFPDEPPA